MSWARSARLTYVADDRQTDETIYRLPELHVIGFEKLIHSYGFCLAKPVESVIRKAVEWADIVHKMMPFWLENYTKEMSDRLGLLSPCPSSESLSESQNIPHDFRHTKRSA